MQKQFYIIRHGETFATKALTWYGLRIFSAPILDEGKPVIYSMAEYLKQIPLDYQVSSPILRCRQTAAIVSEVTDKQFVYDNRISEYFFEPFKLFRYRLNRFLTQIERSDFDNILICTHGAVIAGLTHLLTDGSFHRNQLMHFPKPNVMTVIKDNKVKRITFTGENHANQ